MQHTNNATLQDCGEVTVVHVSRLVRALAVGEVAALTAQLFAVTSATT